MTKFIGRQKELSTLKEFFNKNSASLIVIRGRRRIGKSRLVEEFAKDYKFYRFSGIPPTSSTTAESERNEFAYQLGQNIGISDIKSNDWNSLFLLLYKEITPSKTVILFDEISWMGSKDPDFLGKFKNAWDLYFKKHDKLIFILCGSASFWIEKNILNSTGFVGRISYTLTLEELPLKDCVLFWGNIRHNISAYEKFQLLSVTGGIPKYLEEINPRLDATSNIRKLCFIKGGLLVEEFEHIFSSIFSRRNEKYRRIIEFLSEGSKEIQQTASVLNMPITGRLSEYLHELELSGFIKRDYTWHLHNGADSKLSKYRLSDNYLRFYLKYIGQYKTKINRNVFALKSLLSLPEWHTILGFQFENLVLNNREYIHKSLDLNEEEVISSNPFFQRKTSKAKGCQIDYMIQTKFNTLYICEIKFSKNLIGSNVISEVQQKIDNLKRPKGFSCRPVLIHVNGVQEEVIDSGFFAEIIDFGKFLE